VKDNNIIQSFFSKDKLNPKIWDEDMKLREEVREKLLQTANEFIDFIGVPLLIEDVIFTGSLANYNWSEYSDIDLHVVCDFIQFSETELSLYEELFKVKKTIFNTNHDIKIFGYEVELYVQNATEAHFSSGVYSVLYNDWDVKPEKEDSNIDTKILKSKINLITGSHKLIPLLITQLKKILMKQENILKSLKKNLKNIVVQVLKRKVNIPMRIWFLNT